MELSELQMTIADLAGVEPRSIGTDAQAKEAACWVDLAKKTEADADALLDPAIKEAFAKHRELTGGKKKLLEKLLGAKDRVRMNLANWIAGGHTVPGCYIKTSWKVAVVDEAKVPEEYWTRAIDTKKLSDWAKLTEGKQSIPGCSIEPVNVLYAKEAE